MSLYIDDLRKGIGESDRKRDEGLKTPNEIERFDNIRYGNDKMQVLDVYRPIKDKGTKLPVVVNVHGGGWVYGDKECYQHYCMDIALRGFAVVNFSYRLAPENKFPACVEDTCTVFDFVLNNCDKFGFDIKNIFAVGDSAGAHILSLFSCLCTNESFSNEFSFSAPNNFVPKAIVLNCGVYNPRLENADDTLTNTLLSEVMVDLSSKAETEQMNVLSHIKKGFPSAYIMTSNGDFLKKQALSLSQKLVETESNFVFEYFAPDDEILGHVFNCDIKNKYAKICTDNECDFFKKHIKT